MTDYADASNRANAGEETIDEPQPLRELLPEPHRRGPALTTEQIEELMARFRQRFVLGR